MVDIEREDLEELLEMAFEMWSMSESEWSHYPDADDLAFLLKVSKLSGNYKFIKAANDKIRVAIAEAENDIEEAWSRDASERERISHSISDLSESIAKSKQRLEKLEAIKGGE